MAVTSNVSLALVGYAVLRRQYNRAAPYTRNFEPLILDGLPMQPDAAISANRLAEYVQSEYGLRIPIAVIRDVLQSGSFSKAVERRRGKGGVDRFRLRADALVNREDLRAQKAAAAAEQLALVDGFREFLARNPGETASNLAGREADAIERFIEMQAVPVLQRSLTKSRPPKPAREQDNETLLVANYFYEIENEKSPLFDIVVSEVKGAFIAASLVLEGAPQSKALPSLTVVLDSSVALAALGYDGREAAEETAQIVEALHEASASVVILEASLREMERLLHGVEDRVRADKPKRDLDFYYVDAGKSAVDVATDRDGLTGALSDVGIVVMEHCEFSAVDRWVSADEDAWLRNALREGVIDQERAESSTQHDETFMQQIRALRAGNLAPGLDGCRYLGISLHEQLIVTARRFASELGERHTVPLVLRPRELACLLWVYGSSVDSQLPAASLRATVRAGMLPPGREWRAFLEDIEALQSQGIVSIDRAKMLRGDLEARRIFGVLSASSRKSGHDMVEAVTERVLDHYRPRLEAPSLEPNATTTPPEVNPSTGEGDGVAWDETIAKRLLVPTYVIVAAAYLCLAYVGWAVEDGKFGKEWPGLWRAAALVLGPSGPVAWLVQLGLPSLLGVALLYFGAHERLVARVARMVRRLGTAAPPPTAQHHP